MSDKYYINKNALRHVFSSYFSKKNAARFELNTEGMIQKLGTTFENLDKLTRDDNLGKQLAQYVINVARKENVIPFKNEYRVRKRKIIDKDGKKRVIKDYHKTHYYNKKQTLYNAIEQNTVSIEKRINKSTSSLTVAQYPMSGTKTTARVETRVLKNNDGSLKHRTNGMLKTEKVRVFETVPVFDMSGKPTITSASKINSKTEKITHGLGSTVIGYETSTSYRQRWKKVDKPSMNKNSLYAQGRAYINRDSDYKIGMAWAQYLYEKGKVKYPPKKASDMNMETGTFADRPPHLRDSGKAVKYGKGVYGITYNVKKPKNDYFIGDDGGENYASTQYYADDKDWNRFANKNLNWPTTSHWLEVALGQPVPSTTKIQSIPSGKSNYDKLVKYLAKQVKKVK